MVVFVRLASNKRFGKILGEAWKFGVGPLRNRKYGGFFALQQISEASLQIRDDEWREFENDHRRAKVSKCAGQTKGN